MEKDAIPLLQEKMGYCLLPSMPYHKMFWFYGTGRNGKGVVIRTLEAILGNDTCGNLNLSEFTENRKFSLCHLYGKLMNVSNEPKLTKYGLPTNILKMITGEDTISAEIKRKNERLVFKNYAKLIVLGNRFPKVDDQSLGWWDRIIPLNFPNSFEGDKCKPNIEKNGIPEELSGIFNWMLEGLYRVYEQNGFTTSKSIEETKAEYMKQSNPFSAWIIENTVFVKNAYITRDEALTDYENYCDELDIEKDSKRVFYEKMRQTPKVKAIQKKVSGKNVSVFEGITLKVTEVAEVAVSHIRKLEESLKVDSIDSSNSATFATDPFYVQCFDCKKSLNKKEVYSFGGNPFCRECRLKLEDQKKGEAQ